MKRSSTFILVLAMELLASDVTHSQSTTCSQAYEEFSSTLRAIDERLNVPNGKEDCGLLASAYESIQNTDETFAKSACPPEQRQEASTLALKKIEEIYQLGEKKCGSE